MTAIEIPTPDPRTFDDATRPFAEAVSAHFAIKRLIGSGGMGMVFLARDRRLDRLVAIKTLPPNLARDAAVRERFLRETRTAGGLAHPNIVPIHGADEIDGHVYFVMSYVDGNSLATLVRAHGQLAPQAVSRYMRDVASALAYSHSRGIVHRDIKAENILVDRASDRALVTDFGIARLAEASPLTITGQVLGTVHYVSPEQVSGNAIDARSDLYSLGIVGFFALTGRFPFDADVASAVLVQHVTTTAPPVAAVNRDVPAGLASIVDRCLMKDPAHRFASAEELLAALESALPTLDRPAVISDTAAHAVWQLAAELQANTGVEPRPASVASERSPAPRAKPGARNPGFRMDEVVSAAAEAGIDERYVDRALAERGLAGAPAAPRTPVRAEPAPRQLPWSMALFDTLYALDVEGEVRPRDIDRLLTALRDLTGSMGVVHARTRELAWESATFTGDVEVKVVPADGQTKIEVVRHLRRRVLGAVFLGSAAAGLVTMLAIGVPLAESMNDNEGLGLFAGAVAGIAMALKLNSVLLRGVRGRAAQRVRAIGDAIAARVRESIGDQPRSRS